MLQVGQQMLELAPQGQGRDAGNVADKQAAFDALGPETDFAGIRKMTDSFGIFYSPSEKKKLGRYLWTNYKYSRSIAQNRTKCN